MIERVDSSHRSSLPSNSPNEKKGRTIMTDQAPTPGTQVKCFFATSRSTIERTVTVTEVNADGTFAGTIKVSGRTIFYPAIEISRIVRMTTAQSTDTQTQEEDTVTRKHFTAIAAILAADTADDPVAENLRIACGLAEYLASENPRFDIERFMDASGFEVGTYTVTGGFGPRSVRPR